MNENCTFSLIRYRWVRYRENHQAMASPSLHSPREGGSSSPLLLSSQISPEKTTFIGSKLLQYNRLSDQIPTTILEIFVPIVTQKQDNQNKVNLKGHHDSVFREAGRRSDCKPLPTIHSDDYMAYTETK